MDRLHKRNFPRQLFSSFLLSQGALAVEIFLLLGFGLRFYLKHRLQEGDSSASFLLWLSAGVALLVSFVTCWNVYKMIQPLGRILDKAQGILNPEREVPMDILSPGERGEWSELDWTLNRIRSEIERKNTFLSRDQEEIQAMISALSDAVLAIDKESNLLFYNSQFALLFGTHKMMAHLRLPELVRSPEILEAFAQTMTEGKAHTISTALQPRPDQPTSYYSLSVAPLRQPKTQEIYGAVGVFHDVTELKRAEQIRIEFVANVSHELRTPLTSIKGYTQTLREDFKEAPEASRYLEVIERNADRLLFLVNDLLNLSSLESGAALEKTLIPIAELTERVLAQLEAKRMYKQQTILAHYEVEQLEADPGRVEQVLFNLVENAIKYVPSGKKIDIFWRKHPGGEVTLHVVDDGPGIPPEHLPRLFERFYRVDRSRTRDMGGTGLGLAIVKHIMQRHGGSVRVESGQGQGTEFICSFPPPGA